jgi:hypothetical protein
MTGEDYIKMNGRGRAILDLVFWQKNSSDSEKFQGILVGTDRGDAIVKTRKGTRRFNMRSGFEHASRARGGGMKIVERDQLKAQDGNVKKSCSQ